MYFNNEIYVYVCLYIWMCIFIFICTCILMICMKQMYKLFFFSLLFCYQSVIFDLIAVGGWGLSFACQDAIGWQRPLQLLYWIWGFECALTMYVWFNFIFSVRHQKHCKWSFYDLLFFIFSQRTILKAQCLSDICKKKQ